MRPGARISHLVSRHVKAEFRVVLLGGGGQGGGQGGCISHLVSRYVKAEFCVVLGGEGGQGCEYHTKGPYPSDRRVWGFRDKWPLVRSNFAFGTPKVWLLAAIEGWPLVRGK